MNLHLLLSLKKTISKTKFAQTRVFRKLFIACWQQGLIGISCWEWQPRQVEVKRPQGSDPRAELSQYKIA